MTTDSPQPGPLVWGLGIAQILAWGSSYYWPALFTAAVAAETGWSATVIVSGLTVGLSVSGILTRGLGHRMHRWGPRRVMVAGAMLLAAGLVGLGLAHHLMAYWLAWAVLGAGMACGLYDAGFATLAAVLKEKSALAIARLTLLGGLASTVCWPISHFLIETIGWRAACFVYAGLHVSVSLPIFLRLLPKQAVTPVAAARAVVGPTAAERPLMLTMGAILVLQTLLSATMAVHLPGLLQASGLSLTGAVAIAAWLGPAQVVARAVQTLLTARLTPLATLFIAVGAAGCGLALLFLTLTVWSWPLLAVVGVLIYGAGNGLLTIAKGTLPLQLFGRERYARVLGHLAAPSLIAQALAPLLLTWALTQTAMSGLVGGLVALVAVSLGLTAVLGRWVKAAPVPSPLPAESLHRPSR
ncbi:MFS transporter [Elstera cyanobacteriorum]|uniref:MFS transporter n=1 Tax=Elstera cyanobacteriorum TaxID=2022747 RepID=UPI002354472C|nr:MFS transporter [Elstera cyanobacteriorum]MCK6443165.1 MFS transporter [Elstera cyanobacteriorum]